MNQPRNRLGNSDWYMAWYQNKDVLMNSSSGGAFTALAEVVLKNGGVVFGAYFDENTWDVYHKEIANEVDLNDIRGSKYYQSKAYVAYSDCKKYLGLGRDVLFSGTACQIAALYNFLGKQYDKLITVDVLCHGTASKAIVKKYAISEERKAGKPLQSLSFRQKGLIPWRDGCGTSMYLRYKDGTTKLIANGVDTFFLAFNGNLILRPSCYECHFTGTDRISDFTLSDYWGVDNTCASEYNLENGISVVVVNTDKARELLKCVSEDFIYGPIDPMERAVPCNLAFTRPQSRNINRTRFFAEFYEADYDSLIRKIFRTLLIKQEVKKILGPKGVAMIKKLKQEIRGGKEYHYTCRSSFAAQPFNARYICIGEAAV